MGCDTYTSGFKSANTAEPQVGLMTLMSGSDAASGLGLTSLGGGGGGGERGGLSEYEVNMS